MIMEKLHFAGTDLLDHLGVEHAFTKDEDNYNG